jgi:16S rRNA (guanine966-N2)-methyltransferase
MHYAVQFDFAISMSNPRIIAGTARGLRLKSVPGDKTRPITDRTKESLFNIIGGDIEDSNFLDLFAGTGSVGIEALSRGAKYALFVDNQKHAIETIKYNLKKTKLTEGTTVILADAFQIIQRMPDKAFDYIYIAPPQYHGIWLNVLKTLDKNTGLLNNDAWIIVQIHPVELEDISLTNLQVFDQRRYGSTMLIFLSLKQ